MTGDDDIAIRRQPVVVVGSGVAGLSVALAHGQATVITNGVLGATGSSRWAQGGIAAAVGPGDDVAAHRRDTVAVGAGLNTVEAVEAVVDGGPAAIERLVALGARFDRTPDGSLALGREAAHSRRRIVHANGDATGAEVMRTLVGAALDAGLTVRESTTAIDLLVDEAGSVVGVLTCDERGRLVAELAGAVVLATGGYAHCFARTTAPPAADGSGIAMAARAGALVADMEFVQFHPTALAVGGTGQLPLLTEALRGDGAVIVDERGHRFVAEAHPDAELAPRDVVALAVHRQIAAGRTAFLDTRTAIGADVDVRFPTVFSACMDHGIDPRTEPIPITPAAHYCMGGVATDTAGRSSLAGLWVIGEAASSGAHGGNRLASNSLLDGLAVGHRAGRLLRTTAAPSPSAIEVAAGVGSATDDGTDRIAAARELLAAHAGVERDGPALEAAARRLDAWPTPASHAERTVVTVARLVIAAARRREESRGAHRRRDHPEPAPRAGRTTDRLGGEPRQRLVVDGARLRAPASVGA